MTGIGDQGSVETNGLNRAEMERREALARYIEQQLYRVIEGFLRQPDIPVGVVLAALAASLGSTTGASSISLASKEHALRDICESVHKFADEAYLVQHSVGSA